MNTDYVQRFLFEDLDVRGRLACLGGAWTKMVEGRGYPAAIESLLGRAAALTVLLGANQKGSRRTTLQVRGSGPVTLLVVDCTPDLRIRGMAQYGELRPLTERELFGDGRLALTLEESASGQVYQSLVPLEGDTLADIFSHYLAQSEQLSSFLVLFADANAACGLLLEKLPGADAKDADGWNRVTQLAATLTLPETVGAQPYDLLTKLFPEELLRVFALDAVEHHCPYDPASVKHMLRSLGRAELDSILAERGEIVVKNEMCNHEYRFDRAAVEAFMAEDA